MLANLKRELIVFATCRRKLAQQADDEEQGAIFQANEGSIGDKAVSVWQFQPAHELEIRACRSDFYVMGWG